MSKKIKLGLIGCGGISSYHIQAGYKALKEKGYDTFDIIACCDNNAECAGLAAKEISGFQETTPKVFKNVEKMVKSGDIDAVDICLPHYLHHTVAGTCLKNGCHVMIEKPFGLTIKASRKIIEIAKKYKRLIAVSENIRRFLPARATSWAIRDEKKAGNIYSVLIQHVGYKQFNYEDPAFKWRGIKLLGGGGMIMDSGAHLTDMMLYLFGEVDEVYCIMDSLDRRVIKGAPVVGDHPADVEDTWHAVIRFKNGVNLTWTCSHSFFGENVVNGLYFGSKGTVKDRGFVFHCFQEGGDFIGSDGKIVPTQDIQIQYLMSISEEEKNTLFPYGCTDGAAVEIWDFISAIKGKRKPEISGEEGLKAKALCEACYESATLEKPVKYADVLNGTINSYQKPIDEFWKIS